MRESDKIQVIQGSFENSPSLANRNLCRKQRTVELACTKAYFGCEIFKVLSPLQKNSYIKQGLSAPAVHTRFLITCTPAVSWGGRGIGGRGQRWP